MRRTWERIDRINRARISNVAGYMALFNGGYESGDEVYVSAGASAPVADPDDVVSDDFAAASLSDMWVLDNPSGGSVELGESGGDSFLQINVPSGGVDAWNTNTAPHLMQACGDIDFDITVKMITEPSGNNHDQGILVELDNNDFIRFDVYHNGSELKIFVGEVVAGTSTARANATISTTTATYIRLQRTGTTWLYQRSTDGVSWTTVLNRVGFTMTVANVGIFAGGSTAYTAQFDYFFDTDNPVDPEDGASASRGTITVGQEVDFGAASGAVVFDRIAVMSAASGGTILDQLKLPASVDVGTGDTVKIHYGRVIVT